jgi:hypothetical protein
MTSIPTTPPDPENGTKVQTWMRHQERKTPRLADLRERLVAIAGWGVIYNDHEYDLPGLVRRGRSHTGPVQLFPRGVPGECHANCARAWTAASDRFQIVTGYVLTAEGTWIGHSWLQDATGTTYETIPEYLTGVFHRFGLPLPPSRARRFAQRET